MRSNDQEGRVMKILVVHGKHGNDYINASTPEKEKLAYLKVVRSHQGWGFYQEYDELIPPSEPWKLAYALNVSPVYILWITPAGKIPMTAGCSTRPWNRSTPISIRG